MMIGVAITKIEPAYHCVVIVACVVQSQSRVYATTIVHVDGAKMMHSSYSAITNAKLRHARLPDARSN